MINLMHHTSKKDAHLRCLKCMYFIILLNAVNLMMNHLRQIKCILL